MQKRIQRIKHIEGMNYSSRIDHNSGKLQDYKHNVRIRVDVTQRTIIKYNRMFN